MKFKTCKRYNEPGHAHELTFSCYKNRPFLSKDRTCEFLADAICRARRKHAFHLWAYVFMPTHVHLLLWPTTSSYSISNILFSIKLSTGRRAIGFLRRNRPEGLKWVATGQKHTPYSFWREGGGYDRNINSRQALKKMVGYIHGNPVRKGLVASPEDWHWSSAAEWNTGESGPISIDRGSFPVL